MPLTPGTRVGQYDIGTLLGAGGLVYGASRGGAPPIMAIPHWTALLRK